jgi:hypothetical protein
MSFDRQRLFRANKLTIQRINEVNDGVETSIADGITPDVQPGVGKFAIDWNLPSVESYMFDGLVGNDLTYSKLLIPWVVPPPLDFGSSTGVVNNTTPVATLRRVSIGFDQMMTGRAFSDLWDANGACLDYELQAGGYGFTLELWEKTPSIIAEEGMTGIAGQNVPDNLLWSQTVSNTQFTGDVAFNNPIDIPNMRVTIQPYRTYVWYIRFTGLVFATAVNGVTRMLAASGFHLRGEFEYPLMVRDTATGFLAQNIPSLTGGDRQAATIALDSATSDSIITATIGVAANGRVQRNMKAIDDRLAGLLKAGYAREGDLPVEEELIEDQSLCVLAVPMFGQIGDIRASDLNLIGLPWGPQGNFDEETWSGQLADRRLIRIQHPMSIHRVIVVANHYSPPISAGAKPRRVVTSGLIPASATFTNKVGVGIASGIDGADDRKYQQIAYLEWTPATAMVNAIDRIKEGGTPPFYGLGTNGPYDHLMLDCPLVYNAALALGMYGLNTGTPVYVGRAGNDTEARTTIAPLPFDFGGGARAAPTTNGREQFIEVRWTMTDSAGLSAFNGAVNLDTCYVGNGGCWVYIIGKKSPVTLEG